MVLNLSMPFRRRIKRITRNKGHSTHSATLISNTGPGSAPAHMRVIETEGGARTQTGVTQNFAASRDTDEKCNIGDVIKFINLFIQCGPRTGAGSLKTGWLEWAVIIGKEAEVVIPITQLGVQTLGVTAIRMFPQQCLLTGAMPVGEFGPNYQAIQIKLPKKANFLRMGDKLDFVTYFRTVNSVETGVDNVRLIKSFIYQCYY